MQKQLALWFWRLLRWLYAAWFMYVGYIVLNKLLRGGVIHVHEPNAAAQAFSDALDASRFMDPTLAVCYLGGGTALLFHIFLTGMIFWGVGWAAAWLLMAWRYRKAFMSLISYKD
jgi:hypothetical protein